MTNLIDNPTYITFKNAMMASDKMFSSEYEPSITDICVYFKVSPAVAAAWLQRYKRDIEKEGL